MSEPAPKPESLWRRLGRFLLVSCLIGFGFGVVLQAALESFGVPPHFFDLEPRQMAGLLLLWFVYGVFGALMQASQRKAAARKRENR